MDNETLSKPICKLCTQKEAIYVCPKCNIPYCSLHCYRSELHIQCSESFYKDNVIEQIKSDELDPQSQKKMLEILQRVQHVDEQYGDEELCDSDDDDEEEELAARLSGVDIDDADSVWQKLTVEERNEFEQFLRSGDVSTIVPQWQPWWFNREQKKLVEDLESGQISEDSKYVPSYPPIKKDIQPFSKLSKVTPSPNVRWNIVNVLAAYSVTARVYNGDHLSSAMQAATTLLSLSASLASGQVYQSPEQATAAVHLAAVQDNCFMEGVDESQLKDDVKRLVEGPCESKQEQFVLAALSDIQELLIQAKYKAKENSKLESGGEFSKRFPDGPNPVITSSELNKFIKKIDFYLSWVKEYF